MTDTRTTHPRTTDARLDPIHGQMTVHDQRRRPRRLRVVVALLAVGLITATVHVGRLFLDDLHQDHLGTDGWPSQGQGAYRVGGEAPAESDGQRPAQIASLAKVMTAYIVLRSMPLHDGDDGPLIDVTDAGVGDGHGHDLALCHRPGRRCAVLAMVKDVLGVSVVQPSGLHLEWHPESPQVAFRLPGAIDPRASYGASAPPRRRPAPMSSSSRPTPARAEPHTV